MLTSLYSKLSIILTLLTLNFFSHAADADKPIDPDNIYPQIKFETNMGDIVVELDRVRAPLTVDNFLYYVVNGEYDGTIFHRVIADFVVQGGGYEADYTPRKEKGEIVNESGNGLKNELGTIAMARENKPHTAKRQFFFNAADNTDLDPGKRWGYTVFGAIIEGEEVLEQMAKVETDFNEDAGWPDVPLKPIILKKATLLPAQ